MKTVNVVAAMIVHNGKVLATQRGYGEFADGWEFPGGKIKEGETPEDALRREIREELDLDISVGSSAANVEYDYPNFHLSMACYWCQMKSDDFTLKEHKAFKWLGKQDLVSVDWLPADREIIPVIQGVSTVLMGEL